MWNDRYSRKLLFNFYLSHGGGCPVQLNSLSEHSLSLSQLVMSSLNLRVCLRSSLRPVPVGSPSHGGDVKVHVLDINQPSLPTPFTLFLCLFLSYGPFTCISFHKFSRQLSVFSLCSPSLISASLVLSTIYLFMKVSFSPDIIPIVVDRAQNTN